MYTTNEYWRHTGIDDNIELHPAALKLWWNVEHAYIHIDTNIYIQL